MSVDYEVVIGVEVHAQLRTQTKLFCPCGTTFGLTANSQNCPVCLGLPGTLPVINEKAVEMAVRAGLAMNGTIGVNNRFARKNYFYPDFPKVYQISQYEAPICEHGWIEITVGGSRKRVRIRRAHLEEDAGKNLHEAGSGMSLVDLNRAGTPLLEIVTEPDLSSSEEVVAYLKALRELLMYLDVCDGNMEEGSFRCEPNLSLRPVGQKAFGTKVELKNINSFKFVKDAVDYEIKRQTRVLNEGGKIFQETRLWNHERTIKRAIKTIREELVWWEEELIKEGKLVESQRLHQRTMYDREMIKEMGFCHGIENYSRHLTGKKPGEPPPTLLHYLPNDAIIVIDESHQTIPQLGAMYKGDQSRKGRLSNTDSGCRRQKTTGRYASRNLRESAVRRSMFRRRPAILNSGKPAVRSSNRSSARPDCSIRKSKSDRSAGRSTIF